MRLRDATPEDLDFILAQAAVLLRHQVAIVRVVQRSQVLRPRPAIDVVGEVLPALLREPP